MAKYLVLWEVDQSRVPVDAKERGGAWSLLLEMVKQDLKSGIAKDWGAFVGEINGYAVHEGTEVEVASRLVQYSPYVSFKVHPIASVDQVEKIIKSLSG
ncbi:MAG: hypothetical protein FJ022_07850 [Chloroflexi bacterium]|nr:hypothetical protein [Chloroflexota bacterium]MBM3167413.1 hypothetical protein [Chloroflexota bacterium]MBM3173885.1 hypothetical protein [Chloroflexota bacterium]MBM4450687.1 hypothetical protein [Chloroflexota bacterium]